MAEHWVFGYGSLIWKADFPYLEQREASIVGWQRRFWQGSHDHRGTPAAPGRVVTLAPVADAICAGVAYRVEEAVFSHLDHREKNGYRRETVDIRMAPNTCVTGTVYYADQDNPAYLGAAPLALIARQITGSHGPSGSNREYLLELAAALRARAITDDHVFALESLVLG